MKPTRNAAGIALLAALVGCATPPLPRDDLVLGDDVASSKKKATSAPSEREDPDGTTLGDPAQEPAPSPKRAPGDGPSAPPAPAGCLKDAECNQAGRICTNGTCVKGCRTTAQCPANQTCNAGQCAFSQSNVECYVDVDCDYGSICISAACVPGCYGSYDCPTGQVCNAGQCKAAATGGGTTTTPQCTSDGACNPGTNGSGKICSPQGTCVPGCHRDNQCPGATICTSGACR